MCFRMSTSDLLKEIYYSIGSFISCVCGGIIKREMQLTSLMDGFPKIFLKVIINLRLYYSYADQCLIKGNIFHSTRIIYFDKEQVSLRDV